MPLESAMIHSQWLEGFCCYITRDCHTRRSGGCFCFDSKILHLVLIFDFKFYYSVSEVSSAMRSGSSKSSIWQPSTFATRQSW